MEELRKAFSTYLDECSKLRNPDYKTKDNLSVILNKKIHIRSGVQLIEEQPEFHKLVSQTMDNFSRKNIQSHESHWKNNIQNILRRSGIYLDWIENSTTKEQLFSRYVAAISPPQISVKTIAPIELVSFSSNSLSFDSFELKKFSKEELAELTQNDILEIFYPSSKFDLDLLSNYWWVVITDDAKAPDIDNNLYFLNLGSDILSGEVYGKLSKSSKIEKALQILTLFDWQHYSDTPEVSQYETKDQHKEWHGFSVPFTILLNDCYAETPKPSPDLSRLIIEPKFAPSGEEVGEGPILLIYMDEDETAKFQITIAKYDSQLSSIFLQDNEEWKFIEIALGYLVKAFFSKGLDQLLWHITVIEALLGKKSDASLTDTLASRCVKILSNSQAEGKKIRAAFKELYNFRSSLVHGSVFETSVFNGHLYSARNISRSVASWFVNYLSFVSINLATSTAGFPSRSELIGAIDLKTVGERNRVQALLQCLPSTFPDDIEIFPDVLHSSATIENLKI